MLSGSGRLAVESMAGLAWNQWQLSRGIGGRLAMESVAGLAWNTQAAIQEGLDSGVSDRTVGEIWAEAEARHQAKNG